MARVLVADDEAGVRNFLCEALRSEGHEVDEAEDGARAIQLAEQTSYQVAITDLRMPGADGLSVLRAVKERNPDVQVIVLTAFGSVASAVEAMKLGACDYLQKPLSGPAELRRRVEQAIELHRARASREMVERDPRPRLSWGAPAMDPVVRAIERVAPTTATVLLLGESGTGKEIAARAVHQSSPRARGPFVAVNCAALAENLLESELFGHEKGAFTGATARRRGRIELAGGGTFFLDEVGELGATLQPKLLRVLQERRFERVGGNQAVSCDVRWIAATNRDLEALVRAGGFRQDLYHRLAAFPIHLPALRDRPEDLLPLAEALLEQIGAEIGRRGLRLHPDAAAELRAARWPGNIRQLRNVLERAAILCDGDTIAGRDLAPPAAGTARPAAAHEPTTLAEIERDAVERTLLRFEGNRRRAAEHLGIGLRTLYEKLERWRMS